MRPGYFLLILWFIIIHAHMLSAQGNGPILQEKWKHLVHFCDSTGADEIIVIKGDEVAGYWKNEKCDSAYFNTASMVKSWTGLVIGIMIGNGLIKSEEDKVCDYLPEWEAGCRHDVRIKHLMSMSAGIDKRRGAQGILAVHDMHTYALNMQLDTTPGIRFSYSNESVQLLGMLIEKVAGKSANAYFTEVLFDPLGMDSTRLAKDPAGNDVVFGGAKTTIQDAAQVGLLMLNRGKYNKQQVIAESWIDKTVTPSNNAPYYGYLWWLDNNSEHHNFAAMGDGGKLTIVFPDLGLVFLRQQSCNLAGGSNMAWMGPGFLRMISGLLE